MSVALLPLVPLAGAILPALAGRAGKGVCAALSAAVTLAAIAVLAASAGAVYRGEVVMQGVPWMPQLGLSFSAFLDGLGFFFAAMILLIGLLIIVYAGSYLSPRDTPGRFFAFLLLFQGSMLGVVTSDNLLLLAIYWELTSLSSFMLIGYWSHLPEGRQGARMALTVTGGGGLLLVAGFVLLAQAAGSWNMTEILQRGEIVRASPLYVPALLLIVGGAFTKSAQFPFHFWLPHAMAAPTPVSAYLHSATMVKAGIFLLARLWPVLGGTDLWFAIVAPVGLATMLVGAWIALFRTDLKAILAYSTVSHLGLITMLLGFATPFAVVAAVFHILNHATFKAALFMSAGIVDHEAGTRDINRLGGLARLMPLSATLGLLAAGSMAGIPLLNGFLSKEMMLEAAAHTPLAGNDWLVAALATAGAVLSVAYSVRFAWGVYLGPVRSDYPHHPHDPPAGLWLPVAVLVAAVVAIGIAPALVAGAVVERTALGVLGPVPLPEYSLAIWHGLTPALALSLAAFVLGGLALAMWSRLDSVRLALPRLDAKAIFDATLAAATGLARRITSALHSGSLPADLGFIIATLVVLGAAAFLTGEHAAGTRPLLGVNAPALLVWASVVISGAAVVAIQRNRLLTLVVTSVIGLGVSLLFVQFSAPDLALTQITVEVVTTVLLLLALNLIPREPPRERISGKTLVQSVLAIVCGLGLGGLAYAVMTRDGTSISGFHIAEAKPGGGGTNVVNVILVDFRGFDTFGEIIVLGIAAITIYALLDGALKGAAARRLSEMRQGREAADAHPLLLVVVTRALLPLALMVGVYIFLRGHNLPGGGFIAGLVVAIAILMQFLASGYAWAVERRRLDAHTMVGAGVLIAGATGAAAFLFGRPFLTSTFAYLDIPLAGKVEVASAMAFDLGVFLTVVGTVLLSLIQIGRVEARAERMAVPEGPHDVKLRETGGGAQLGEPVMRPEA
jgi:multicomponent K+:H+ antiporter subunit A